MKYNKNNCWHSFKEQFFRKIEKKRHIFGQFFALLTPNFWKCCTNNLECSEILVLVELQRICNIYEYHSFYTYDTPPKGRLFKHFDNFNSIDINFKNLIGGALDIWWKTELAPYFEVTNNDVSGKLLMSTPPVSMGNRIGDLDYLSRTQLWWLYPSMHPSTKCRGWIFA